MTIRFKSKIKKMRGSTTHGYGSKKKHRGKGSKGGRGRPGGHKHHFSYVVKYDKERFGYKGFIPAAQPKEKQKVINVDELELLSKKLNKKELNLIELGYDKLLGRGEIKSSLTVKISQVSKSAKEKIEAAGGTVAE